jgi:DNA-binding NarL/FixJ family response regulator
MTFEAIEQITDLTRDVLTPAEAEVAALALDGLSNADIAARRRSSCRTVANQMSSIFRKLGIASRGELGAWARARAGWSEPSIGPAAAPLSPREARVLAQLASGCANKRIAIELALAPSTVSSVARRALRKLGVRRAWHLRSA